MWSRRSVQLFVHNLEVNSDGQITGVVYEHNGENVRQLCRAVFLCAGAVETPRLLLRCDEQDPAGLANSSGQVGRNFMAHVATQVWGTFGEQTRPNKGFPASLISEDMIRPKEVSFAGGYIMQSLGIVPITWAMQVARGRGLRGRALVNYLDHYNSVAGLGINGDCLPAAGNFLELATERDTRGMRKPLIHFSYGENETAMSAHAEGIMTAVWQAAGAKDIWTFQRSAHIIGTCRMSQDAADGVVDPYGRSFDVPNLWICDNSVFPSALPANPALTIMALSLRTADRFLDRGKASDAGFARLDQGESGYPGKLTEPAAGSPVAASPRLGSQ